MAGGISKADLERIDEIVESLGTECKRALAIHGLRLLETDARAMGITLTEDHIKQLAIRYMSQLKRDD